MSKYIINNYGFLYQATIGNARFEQLSIFCRKRLQFLQQVWQCQDTCEFQSLLQKEETAVNSECLIEGTKKDRISHFCLRLMCASDSEMTSFLVKAETQLFCLRFANMNFAELVSLLKSTYRFVHKLIRRNHSVNKDNILKSAEDLHLVLDSALASGRTWKTLVELYLNNDFSDTFGVPFQYALSLVKSREVLLNRGVAFIPCAKLHQILASLFEQIVADGMKRANYIIRQVFVDDKRMVDLFKEVRHLYYAGRRIGSTVHWDLERIGCADVDSVVQSFPPCMQNLHRALRKKHRLRHFSRVQYTLFLKEIGMPVQEAIRFWQREYSQPPGSHSHTGSSGCEHNWSKDSRRYTYNIRHLYGLEGSRINYKAHSCYAMQNCTLGYGEDGGCVFTHFDEKNLKGLFNAADVPLSSQTLILDLVQNKKHQMACETYFQHTLRQRQSATFQYQMSESDKTHKDDESEIVAKMKGNTIPVLCYDDEPDIKRTKKERICVDSKVICTEENNIDIDVVRWSTSDKVELQDINKTQISEIKENTMIVENSRNQVSIGALVDDVNIEKPSDYFFSYMQLLRALQSL